MSNLLIKNAVILTVNSKNEVIPNGAIGLADNRITNVTQMDQLKDNSADEVIDAKGMVVMPGFVNSHTHLSMTLFRGVADDVPGINWLPIIWSIEKNINEDFCYTGALLGCLEMIKTGTTCFADQYWHMDQVANAVKESGIRADLSQGILELNDPEKGARELKESVAFAKEWNNPVEGRITCKLGPHSIYTCSPSLLQQTREAADEADVGLHIHVAEGPNEPRMAKEKHGDTSIGHLDSLGFLKDDVLAAHCVYVNNRDMDIMKKTNTAVAHCPSPMMKYGNEIAPVPDLLSKKVTVGIGTDGCGSNNNLDMIEEMRTGSIEVGKKADLIFLDFKKPHLAPFHHCPSHIVYSAFGSDVDTMIVDGKIIMKNRVVTNINEVEIIEKAQSAFEELLNLGGYTLDIGKNPKPGFKTNLAVKSFQTFLKISQKIKRT
jgi:5-methylthioadenosine/S-adenosylhomocysteine deaminase